MKARCKDCTFFLKEINRCSIRKTKHTLSPGKPRICTKFNTPQQKVKSNSIKFGGRSCGRNFVPADKKISTKEISTSKPDVLIPKMPKVKKKGFLKSIKVFLGK